MSKASSSSSSSVVESSQQGPSGRPRRCLTHPGKSIEAPTGRSRAQHVPSSCWSESQRTRLIRRRRALSHELSQKVQKSYLTLDVRQRQISLLEVYREYCQALRSDEGRVDIASSEGRTEASEDSRWFPAGTGDCCAPKLIHACLMRGLRPHSMVEWWHGSPPNTATKQGRTQGSNSVRKHGVAFPSCLKCESVLGSLLCNCP